VSYFHCGNGYPDRCNGYVGPLDARTCTSARHKYDESGRQLRCTCYEVDGPTVCDWCRGRR
jgi:hypothetical protein